MDSLIYSSLSPHTLPPALSPLINPSSSDVSGALLARRPYKQTSTYLADFSPRVHDGTASTEYGGPLRKPSSDATLLQHRTSPRSGHPFSSMTPIIASPMSSPATSISSHNVHPGMQDTGSKDAPRTHFTVATGDANKGGDHVVSVPAEVDVILKPSVLTPTWTSTPPTPPPKESHQRSASLVMARLPSSSAVIPSASFPDAPSPATLLTSREIPKRRASLPSVTASISSSAMSSGNKTSGTSRRAGHDRAAHAISASPLRISVSEFRPHSRLQFDAQKRSVSTDAPRSKPLFQLDYDGNSDNEDGETTLETSPAAKDLHEALDVPSTVPPEDDAIGELNPHNRRNFFEKRDNSRKYYALLELLATEIGYLFDLKVLVTVYLRLLPVLTWRPPNSPAHFGTSSSLTISSFSRYQAPSFMMSSFNSPRTTGNVSSLSNSANHPVSPLSQPYDHHGIHPPSAMPTRDKEKHMPRHLFSVNELDVVTRNAEEILDFHEQFVRELRTVVAPLGLAALLETSQNGTDLQKQRRKSITPAVETLDAVLYGVAMKFVNHVSRFETYQYFCSGHPEALDLVRKAQREHAPEWDAFERRCTAMAADLRRNLSDHPGERLSGEDSVNDAASDTSFAARRKRRHSLSSLDNPARGRTLQPNRSNTNLKATSPVSETGHSEPQPTPERGSKLVFMDYLIKPIQRICKYPLLLSQLQTEKGGSAPSSSRASSSPPSSNSEMRQAVFEADLAIQGALQAMRRVASAVDEARRRQDLAVKSALIVARISQSLSQSSSSSSRPGYQGITPVFLSSLGPCYLAGSLDVIHCYGPKLGNSSTLKAKYLAAFLYSGGYFVLAKVSKGKYEPRHWFPLSGFNITDADKDDSLLPSWFRLSTKGHVFDMAASCRREKDIWVAAIRDALAGPRLWTAEPPSSLHVDSRPEPVVSMLEDGPYETINTLPTIMSIPESGSGADQACQDGSSTQPLVIPDSKFPRAQRPDHSSKHDAPPPSYISGSSRRSSTISVKGYFSPLSESDTMHLVRSTAPAREQVDRELLDVFSEKCLSARFHAHIHEEELFSAPKIPRSFSRSSSGFSMANAKNKLTKRESVLVPRRKSFAENQAILPDFDVHPIPRKSSATKFPGNVKQPKKLKIVSAPKALSSDGDEDKGEAPLDSPVPPSQCSSISASIPGSLIASPVSEAPPFSAPPVVSKDVVARPEFLVVREDSMTPKRSRSMVDNVRGFFHSRSASPTLILSRPSSEIVLEQDELLPSPSLLKWWSKGSLRRRVRSAPDVPADEGPSSSTRMMSKSINDRLSKHLIPEMPPDRPTSQPDLHSLTTLLPNLDVVREIPTELQGQSSPVRRSSLFAAHYIRRRTTAPGISSTTSHEGELTPKGLRLHRNVSFFQRFSPLSSTITPLPPGES